MHKVLVTGSNGLLGQKITEVVLRDCSVNLIATNRGASKYPLQAGFIYEEMDVLDFDKVKDVLEKHMPSTVIHTAAMTNVDICHVNRTECWQLNVAATANLAKICKALNIHFIYLSTDFVFDGLNGPYKEGDLPNPVSYYGESKLAAEQATMLEAGSWCIIRTILVYGVLKDMSRSNIILWAKNALEKQEAINVVNDQWRMPTLAEDLATACLEAAKRYATGIYHVSGKDMMTVVDIVKAVANFYNLPTSAINEVSSATLGQEAKRPLKTGFVLTKAITDLNYTPHSFAEGIEIVNSQLAKINS